MEISVVRYMLMKPLNIFKNINFFNEMKNHYWDYYIYIVCKTMY